MINNMSYQVTNALPCRFYEAWIDIKTKLNVEVISKEGDDLTWYNMNGKMHGTMCKVNEIIQHYFNNLERTQSRAEKKGN